LHRANDGFGGETSHSIGVRINDAVDSEEMRVKMKDYIFQKLVEKGDIDPYFPLTRSGDHWLSYSAPDRTGVVPSVFPPPTRVASA